MSQRAILAFSAAIAAFVLVLAGAVASWVLRRDAPPSPATPQAEAPRTTVEAAATGDPSPAIEIVPAVLQGPVDDRADERGDDDDDDDEDHGGDHDDDD